MEWFIVKKAEIGGTAIGMVPARSIRHAVLLAKQVFPSIVIVYVQTQTDYIRNGGFDPVYLGM